MRGKGVAACRSECCIKNRSNRVTLSSFGAHSGRRFLFEPPRSGGMTRARGRVSTGGLWRIAAVFGGNAKNMLYWN